MFISSHFNKFIASYSLQIEDKIKSRYYIYIEYTRARTPDAKTHKFPRHGSTELGCPVMLTIATAIPSAATKNLKNMKMVLFTRLTYK